MLNQTETVETDEHITDGNIDTLEEHFEALVQEITNCSADEVLMPDNGVVNTTISESQSKEEINDVSSPTAISECDSTISEDEGKKDGEKESKEHHDNKSNLKYEKHKTGKLKWTLKIKVGSNSDSAVDANDTEEDTKRTYKMKKKMEEEDVDVTSIEDENSETDPVSMIVKMKTEESVGKENYLTVGKRKVTRTIWQKDFVSPVPKKAKGGLRPDCPTFCRQNCSATHHPLLIHARRMIENDSSTTMVFLDHVVDHYGGSVGNMTPSEVIHDPWKDTSFPLLHYLALMGKCSGSFALVDAGHQPSIALSANGDTVLHTLVREMYYFNCTHGHMDILLKKFNLLLKEFKDCLFEGNFDEETPFHICANLISKTSKLLNIPGRSKPPFRLYQFLKNMMLSCVDQFQLDQTDSSKLNMQDKDGNTAAHYIAEDRASWNLLTLLKDSGADFSVSNNENETVEGIRNKAPPPPPDDILELAEFSARSNKYKSSASKKPKFSPSPNKSTYVKSSTSLKQTRSNNLIKVSTAKLEKKVLVNTTTNKEKNVTNNKTSVKGEGVKNCKLEKVDSKVKPEGQVVGTAAARFILPKLHGSNRTIVANSKGTVVVSSPLSTLSVSTCVNSSEKATSTSVNSKSLSTADNLKKVPITSDAVTLVTSSVSPNTPAFVAKALMNVAAKKYANFSAKSDALPSMVNTQSAVNVDNTTTMSNFPTLSPHSSKQASTPVSYPLISNVHSLRSVMSRGDAAGSKPLFIFRPPGSQNVNPRFPASSMRITNQCGQPPASDSARFIHTTSSSALNTQQPLLIKTANGKVMSLNLVSVNKVNETPGYSSLPKLNINTSVPIRSMMMNQQPKPPNFPPQQPYLIGQNTVRYMFSPADIMHATSYRQMTPTSMNSSSLPYAIPNSATMLANSTSMFANSPSMLGNSPSMLANPVFRPPMMNPTGQGVYIPPMLRGTFQSHRLRQGLPPVLNMDGSHHLLPSGSSTLPSANFNVNAMVHAKNDGKKNRSLEASIKNLHHSAMSSVSSSTEVQIRGTKNTRLSSNVNEVAPPVIILDNDDEIAEKKFDPRELQSPSIESSQDVHSPSKLQDVDGMASFMKNYLQEKGSITDFLRFSKEKKENLGVKLKQQQQHINDIGNKIGSRENDIKDTREEIVEKEMEIAQLRLKMTNIQNNIIQLRGKRTEHVDACTLLEKRIKTVEDQTALFQVLNIEGRSEI